MPVYKLVEEMPYEEFASWMLYFKKRPVGWQEDDRTFKLLQVQGVKQKPWEIFPSLNNIYKSERSEKDPLNIKGSYFYKLMQNSKGGEKIPYDEIESTRNQINN